MFEIKYEHEQDGVLHIGEITGGTSAAKSVWMSSENAGAPREIPIDEDRFSLLWNGISEFAVFPRTLVKAKKEAAAADLKANHRITVTFKEGKTMTWTYIVPVAEEQDADFARWLAALQSPAVRA